MLVKKGIDMGFCTEVVCDGCGKTLHFNHIMTKGSIIRSARENGWSIGNHELCSSCKTIRKKLKKEGWIK